MELSMQRLSGLLKAGLVLAAFFAVLYAFFSDAKLVFWLLIVLAAFSFFSFSFYLLVAVMVKEPPIVRPKKWPSISVIIPSFNSAKTLSMCLKHVTAMKYPGRVEYLLVDDCSTDGSREIATRFGNVRVMMRNKRGGKASALNYGISLAKGELLACIDSDTYPPTDCLEKLVPYFNSKPNVGAVTVFITAAHPRNLIEKLQELEYYTAFGFVAKTMAKINCLMVTPGPFSIYRRDVILKVGGFDEKNMTEDMEIGLRLQEHGYRIECSCETFVPTEIPSTIHRLYKQRLRWYRGAIFNLGKYLHMFLNSKYSDFGIYSFPATTVYVFMTMVIWAITIFSYLNLALQNLSIFWAWARVGQLPVFHTDGILALSSITVFFVATVAIWWYFFYRSIRLIGVRLNRSHILPALMIILVYPVLNSFFYFVALVMEAKGSVFNW
ncbi:glycosyltransferase family 2 protein [Candidatus Micrarchaeota archaeon]|nr:glycosyltransferase family 2 protein [Candidatus Micrarchaeota archaeon]